MSPDEAARARELGFLRPEKYGHVERERRWLCDGLPALAAERVCEIEDLYITDTRMRLRVMHDRDGRVERKLTKKAELDASRRIITTIYFDEDEHALLSGLAGLRITKTRYYFEWEPEISVDAFKGALAGLFMAEVEFANDAAMAAFRAPAWLGRDVTQDARHSGISLARNGMP